MELAGSKIEVSRRPMLAESGIDDSRLPIAVFLFDGPRVEIDGEPLPLSPQQTALIALVFGHQTLGPTRTEAASAIWERDPDGVVRHRLRQLIVDTNARIGKRLIAARGELLLPDHILASSDYRSYLAAVSDGRLFRAARLLATGFLSRLPPRVSRTFEDWAGSRHSSLEGDLIRLASRVWDHSRSSGRWRQALDSAQALAHLRPGDELTVTKVMEASVRRGRLGTAEAIYSLYLDTLGEKAPDPRVATLARRIGKLSASKPPGPAEAHDGAGRAPLVGRAVQLRGLTYLLDAVASGETTHAVVRGWSGTGKSRLLEELRFEAALRGLGWISLKGSEADQRTPFASLWDALRSHGIEKSLEAAGPSLRPDLAPWLQPRLVAEPRSPAESYDGSPAPTRIENARPHPAVLRFFRRFFAELAADRPTILCADDLQWVDSASVNLLRIARARWSIPGLGVISGITDGADFGREVKKYLLDGQDRSVVLGPLADDAASELVRFHAGKVSNEVARRIRALAGNRPRELVALAKAWDRSVEADPYGQDPIALPATLQPHFGRVLRRLPKSAVSVAAVLAISRRTLSLKALAELAEMKEARVATLVSRLIDAGQVEVEDGIAHISQPLFRSAVLESIGAAECALFHGKLARFLELAGGAPGDVAIHLHGAGHREKALNVAKVAAEKAERDHDTEELVSNLATIVRCTDRPQRTAEAIRALRILMENGLFVSALPFLDTAKRGLLRQGREEDALELEADRVRALAESGKRRIDNLLEPLVAIADDARKVARGDIEARALAQLLEWSVELGPPTSSALKRLHLLAGPSPAGPGTGLTSGSDARVGARSDSRASARSGMFPALLGLSHLGATGDPEAGFAAAMEAVSLAEPDGGRRRLGALHALLVAARALGVTETPSVRPFLSEALERAEATSNISLKCSVHFELGLGAFDAGKRGEARIHLSKVLEAAAGAEMPVARGKCGVALGDLYLEMNDVVRARRAFEAVPLDRVPGVLGRASESGLGLCDLATGSLGAVARRGAAPLDDTRVLAKPEHYLQTALRARVLAANRLLSEALKIVVRRSDLTKDRSIPDWIRLRTLEASLALRFRLVPDLDRLSEVLDTARTLGYTNRRLELEALLSRAVSRSRAVGDERDGHRSSPSE